MRIKKKINYNFIYIWQGFLYILGFITVFSAMEIIVSGNGLTYMDSGDALNQGYPVVGYIQSFVKNKCFFSGFDYSIGLGEDNLLVLACHGFLNPIHWLMAFLFQSAPTYLLYKYILITKFFLGGLSFLIYSNYKKKNPFLSVGASIIYSFSMWAMVYGLSFLGFYDVLIALPIMILGIDYLYDKENSFSPLLILSMVYLGLQGFYYLFWHCLIGAGYFLIKLIWHRKRLIAYSVKFGVNCLSALLIVAPILFPSIYWYFASSRNDRETYSITELLPSLYELKTFLRSFLTPTVNTWSHYLLSTIALFALIVFVLNLRKYKFEGLILIISIFVLITPAFALLLNGFGYITDRGFYFVWFVLAYSILCGFEEILFLDRKTIITSTAILLIYSLFIVFREKELLTFHFTNFVFLVIILTIVMSCLLLKGKGIEVAKIQKILTIIVLLSSVLLCRNNIYFLWDPDNKCIADYATLRYSEKFISTNQIISDEQKDFHQYLCTDKWFRVESDSFLTANESLLKGFYSTNEYFSITNIWSQRFQKELEGQITINSLLGVQYSEQMGKMVHNAYALPIVIGFEDYVTENQLKTWNPLKRQSILLQKIILQKEETQEKNIDFKDNFSTIQCDISYNNLDADGVKGNQYIATPNSHITISLGNQPHNGEFYVALTNVTVMPMQDTGTIDPLIQIGESSCYQTINSDIYCYVVPNDEGIIDISFLQNAKIKYDDLCIYFYSTDSLQKDIETRRDLLNSSTKLLHNQVISDVFMKKNGYLLFTIPYSKGWSAHIDGKPVPIQIADYGLIGLPIEYGKHTVELTYQRPFKTAGWLVFILGIILLFILKYMDFYQKKIRKNTEVNHE